MKGHSTIKELKEVWVEKNIDYEGGKKTVAKLIIKLKRMGPDTIAHYLIC